MKDFLSGKMVVFQKISTNFSTYFSIARESIYQHARGSHLVFLFSRMPIMAFYGFYALKPE